MPETNNKNTNKNVSQNIKADHNNQNNVIPEKDNIPHYPLKESNSSAFISHAKLVSMLTLISRFAGLARDAVCSRIFGASPVWSAFAFAFLIPNLFRKLFGEGALTAAFIPRYTQLTENDPALAQHFAQAVLALITILLASIVILGEAVLLIVVRSIPQDSLTSENTLAIHLLMIMLPYMPLICLVALLGGILQVRGKFGPTAAAPVILNLCIILAALIPMFLTAVITNEQSKNMPIMLVAIAVLAAGFIQLLWVLSALKPFTTFKIKSKSDIDYITMSKKVKTQVKSMFCMMIPMMLGLGVLQFNILLDGLIASYPILFGDRIFGIPYPLDQSSNAILSFTQRLYQFPLGVFGIAVATAIFPALARAAAATAVAADNTKNEFTSTLQKGLRLTVYIGLPASIGLMLVRIPLATVVLRGGEFDPEDVKRVAAVLMGYAPAVCAYSLIHILTRAFYSQNDASTPVRISLYMVALNLVLNLTLIWPLGESGLAWSTSICAYLQCLLLLRKISAPDIQPINNTVLKSWLNTLLSTILMTIVVMSISWLLPFNLAQSSWWIALTELLILTTLGIITFTLSSKLLFNQPEFSWLLTSTKNK